MLLGLLIVRLVLGDDPFTDGIAEREARGQNVRPKDYATTYTWWMALLNFFVVGLALATWRRWRGPAQPPGRGRFAAPARRPPGWAVVGVLLAMVGLSLSAAPRLSQSLWEDETYMVVRSIAGQYVPEADGGLAFDSVSWGDTFFYYRKPNNHVPYSVAARLFNETWQVVARPDHELVNEAVVRMPALLAGMAGLGTLGWLLWRLGLPLAGVTAAWLLAFHPWYLRYASEVRGYAFLLALLPALVIAGLRVLERGSWRRWAVFGAGEMLLLWTYPGGLFVLVVANLYLLVELMRSSDADRRVQATRFLVTNTAAGLAWLQMNLPNLMQFLPYTERWKGEVSLPLLTQVGSHLLLGMRSLERQDGFVSLEVQLGAAPAWTMLALVGAVGATALGLARMARRGSPALGTLAILLVPAPLTLALAAWRGDHLYPWYLIHALPGVALLAAVGVTFPAGVGPAGHKRAAALALAFLAVFFVATHPKRSVLRERALQPGRDMVRTIRSNPDPLAEEHDEILTAAVYGPARYYDPRVLDLPDAEAVCEVMQRAVAQERPLYVTYNRPALAARRRGDALAMLDREDLFERLVVLEGVEPRSRHVVYRHRPGSSCEG